MGRGPRLGSDRPAEGSTPSWDLLSGQMASAESKAIPQRSHVPFLGNGIALAAKEPIYYYLFAIISSLCSVYSAAQHFANTSLQVSPMATEYVLSVEFTPSAHGALLSSFLLARDLA